MSMLKNQPVCINYLNLIFKKLFKLFAIISLILFVGFTNLTQGSINKAFAQSDNIDEKIQTAEDRAIYLANHAPLTGTATNFAVVVAEDGALAEMYHGGIGMATEGSTVFIGSGSIGVGEEGSSLVARPKSEVILEMNSEAVAESGSSVQLLPGAFFTICGGEKIMVPRKASETPNFVKALLNIINSLFPALPPGP